MADVAAEREFARRLATHLPGGGPIACRFTRARTLPIQLRARGAGLELRVHRFFAAAPDDVVADLAAWIRSGRRARRASRDLDAWLRARLQELPPAPRRRLALRPHGAVHDLAALAEELYAGPLAEDFAAEGRVSERAPRPRLTWGARRRSRSRGSLQLGVYVAADHLVRLHPVLDQRAVPRWFVRFILFHELLHAALDHGTDGGAASARAATSDRPRVLHGPAFRRRERTFPHYAQALRFEREHIAALIRSARSGVELRGDRAAEAAPPCARELGGDCVSAGSR